MSRLVWDKTGEKHYETGCDRGVLYPMTDTGTYEGGVAWNGLSTVNKTPSGGEANDIYADNTKYASLTSAETFGATVEAYMYPDEFEECDGSKEIAPGVTIGQQDRKVFGLCFRTIIGNDVKKDQFGHKLHLVYGCNAQPSEKSYETTNDSPEAITMSWELNTTPVNVTGAKPTSELVINSTRVSADALKELEDILYGTSETEARLPLPDEVAQIVNSKKEDEETTVVNG